MDLLLLVVTSNHSLTPDQQLPAGKGRVTGIVPAGGHQPFNLHKRVQILARQSEAMLEGGLGNLPKLRDIYQLDCCHGGPQYSIASDRSCHRCHGLKACTPMTMHSSAVSGALSCHPLGCRTK